MKSKRFVCGLRKIRVLTLGVAVVGLVVFGFWLGGEVSRHPSQAAAAQNAVSLPPPVKLGELLAVR